MTRIVAVIPARSGSKRVPGKNVADVGGKPLVQWSIEWALAQQEIDEVAVTTDCPKVMEVANQFPSVTLIERPVELAMDETPDLPVMQHAADVLNLHDGDNIAHVRPTVPFRAPGLLTECMSESIQTHCGKLCFPVRTFRPVDVNPFKLYCHDGGGMAFAIQVPEPLWDDNLHNRPDADAPSVYRHDGALDLVRVGSLEKYGMGQEFTFVLNDYPFHVDIDELEDLELARHYAARLSQEADLWHLQTDS